MVITLEVKNEIKNDFFSFLNLVKPNIKILEEIEEIAKNDDDYQLYLSRKDEDEIDFDEVKRLVNENSI